MVYIIAFTRARNCTWKENSAEQYGGDGRSFWMVQICTGQNAIPFAHTKQLLEQIWKKADAIMFIGAAGIAVRSIAPVFD